MERLPVILFTTCRCYRELAAPAASATSGTSLARPRHPASAAAAAAAATTTATVSKGDFDPLVETVRAARSCTAIITNLLTLPRPPPPPPAGSGGGSAAADAAVQECLTLSARAGMAMSMVSSTAFGEAVREALVRSPSRELRENAMGVMASLAGIDREVAGEAGAYEGGGGGGGEFVSQTTVMVSFAWYGGAGSVEGHGPRFVSNLVFGRPTGVQPAWQAAKSVVY